MDRWRRRLALVLGIVFILAGIAETARAIRSGDGGLAFGSDLSAAAAR